ncbi:MAG: hypothetical protein KKE30_16805 [Gammaproteobacteria bacterium]|nr:hypothetical protein [Gammaproteobacteria bacterium]
MLCFQLISCQSIRPETAWQEKLNQAVLGGQPFDNVPGLQLTTLLDITADNFTEGKIYTLNLKPVADETALTTLLNNPMFVQEFIDSDYTTARFRFINIIMSQSLYDSAGFALVQLNEHWYWFYQAGVSSKGFLPMFALSQSSDTQYTATLCVSDCSWWGINAHVLLDFAQQQLTLQYLTDDYYR